MKRYTYLLAGFILAAFNLFYLPFVKFPAYALLNPTFSGSRNSTNGNLTFTLTEPADTDFSTTKIFGIPPDFDVTAGSSFAQNAILGSGNFQAVINGGNANLNFDILNDLDLQGNKAHWKFSFFGGGLVLDSFVSGNSTNGHTFTLVAPSNVTISTPVSANFTILGSVGGTATYTLPSLAGEYNFTLQFTTADNQTLTRTSVVNFPATTSNGTNITNNFNGGISVNFDRVLGSGGETTITSSSTAPAAGTGQFQLGGVYYDLNTTANIRCPCTVTVPYDPAVTPTPQIYHLESGVWVDRTTSFDSVAKTVTGVFPSFSFFVVGTPIYNVVWDNPIVEHLEKKGNPFQLKSNSDLGIKFNLSDPGGQIVTPEGVMIEIWQTRDANGEAITPTKVLTLTPGLNENKSRFQTELDGNSLSVGTYEIHITVGNTAASQVPEIAAFNLVKSGGSSISISSNKH